MNGDQPDPQLAAMRRIDAACDRFAAALRAGESPSIDEYVANSDPADRVSLRHELGALARFFAARVDGTPRGEETGCLVGDKGRGAQPRGERDDPGRRLGDYRLHTRLGRGGMGEVWEAVEEPSGRRVALKRIAGQWGLEELEQFLQEGRLAASVSHPRCVFVLAAGVEDGEPYLVMERMLGRTLADVCRESGPLPIARAVDWILDALEGLEALEAAGICHRDVKPGNCFLDGEGRIKIGDFGLATTRDAAAKGIVLGTLPYMSPEQLRGETVGPAADQFSLGATLFHLLSGRAPWVGDRERLLDAATRGAPPRLESLRPEVPTPLARIVARTLAPTPQARYPDLDALRRALAPFSATSHFLPLAGRRLAAFVIDNLLALLLSWMLFPLFALPWSALPGREAPFATVTLLLQMAYFVVCEGRWGAGLGKRWLGLRVVGDDGAPPGLVRAAVRAAFIPGALGLTLLEPAAVMPDTAAMPRPLPLSAIFVPLLFAALTNLPALLCMTSLRRATGFRGWHEFLSGTRVIVLPRVRRHTAPAITVDVVSQMSSGAARHEARNESTLRLGPFVLTPAIHDSANEVGSERQESSVWREGFDPQLRRRVVIRFAAIGAPGVGAIRRQVARVTRPWWLQGGEHQGRRWDAFEAPVAVSLASAVDAGQLDWEALRRPLLDLASEVAEAATDGTLPPMLALSQLSITSQGRLLLSDAMLGERSQGSDRSASAGPNQAPPSDQHAETRDAARRRGLEFLREVTQYCHAGAEWPRHAEEFLLRLGEPDATIERANADLSALQDRPAMLRRGDRLGMLALSLLSEGWLYPVVWIAMAIGIVRLPADMAPLLSLHLVLCAALPGCIAFVFQGGPVLRALGIEVRDRSGGVASRVRSAWRGAVAWLPWAICWGGLAWLIALRTLPDDLAGAPPPTRGLGVSALAGCALFLVGVALAIRTPRRGPADRLAGTWLQYR